MSEKLPPLPAATLAELKAAAEEAQRPVSEQLALIRARAGAQEVSARAIGSYGIVWLVLLVVITVASAAYLPPAALTPVVAMVFSVAGGIMGAIAGVTGTKERSPEMALITMLQGLIERQQSEAFSLEVLADRVVVTKGESRITSIRPVEEKAP